jgi:hypothetical protein
MPDIEEQLKDRMEELAAAQVRVYPTATESLCLMFFFRIYPLPYILLFSKPTLSSVMDADAKDLKLFGLLAPDS